MGGMKIVVTKPSPNHRPRRTGLYHRPTCPYCHGTLRCKAMGARGWCSACAKGFPLR